MKKSKLFFPKPLNIIWRIALLFQVLISNAAWAGGDPPVIKTLDGSLGQVAIDSSVMVEDAKFFDGAYYGLLIKPYPLKNIVSVQINEDLNKVLASAFEATVRLRINYILNDSTSGTTERDFAIKYDPGSAYEYKNVYIFNNCARVEVKVIQLTKNVGWNAWEVVKVVNQLQSLPLFNFDCVDNAITEVNDSLINAKDELRVNWDKEKAADEYDLEWAYIDSSALRNYRKDSDTTQYDPAKIFRNNASRVSIATEAYLIPLLYESSGHLFYRVRAVQIKGNGQRVESSWSSDFPDGLGRFDFEGHEDKLNWQSSITFAEEGKRKAVIQYFDGSLRNRQTVTKDNTTDTTIIAETFYDHQGRPAVQVLPSPSLSSIIKYTPNFNSPLNASEYTKELYDGLLADSCFCSESAPPMDTVSGASQYYSPANPLANSGFHKYIPDANMYPFAETRYTGDNTGRVAIQGGVDSIFRIGSTHETRFFYSGADQEELDALFGTEVGSASHYFKNMVRDANGQYSVSYVDMHGRTIATALAGKPEVKLDTLESNKTQLVIKKLLDSTTNIIKGRSIESSKGLLVTRAGDHKFVYSLEPDTVSLEDCVDSICYDCSYDLVITITDDCNNATLPDGEPIVITKSNLSFDTACLANNTFPGIDTTFYLREGNYLISKRLTISKQSMDFYRDSIFLKRNDCKTLETFIEEQRQLLVSLSCTPACESCVAGLGTQEEFRENYMSQNSIPFADTADYRAHALLAYHELLEQCNQLCNNSGIDKSIRQQMLADASSPHGQYANPDDVDGWSIFWKSVGALFPRYRTDVTYVDENGQPDAAAGTLEEQEFSARFKSSWADSLLKYHPEYLKLKKYEELSDSHIWDEKFGRTESFQAAVDSGYLNPANFSGLPGTSIFAYNSDHRDPLFTDLAPGYKQRMLDSLRRKIILDPSPLDTINAWSLATIMAHCPTGDQGCLDSFKPIAQAFTIDDSCSGELDIAWQYFREMYLQEKREIVNLILEEYHLENGGEDLTNLTTSHTLNFVDPNLLPQQNITASTGAATDSLSQFIDSNCIAFARLWWQELKPCGFTVEEDSADVISILIEICREGGDLGHPFGASSIRPGSSYNTPSFEAFLKNYCDTTGKDYDATCNVYLITAPPLYGKETIRFDKAILQKPDSCECATINNYYQSYVNYNESDTTFSDYLYRITSTRVYEGVLDTLRMACNGQINCSFLKEPLVLPPALQCGGTSVCANCDLVDSLYADFKEEFPDVVPQSDDTDSLQQEKNRLFERFMNAHLGFSKKTWEYLAFMDTCQINIVPDCEECDTSALSTATLQSIRDEFINNYYNFGRKYDANGCDTITWRINYPSTFVGYPVNYGDVFASGAMQFPDTLGINGTPDRTNYDFVWRDTACVERRFALEFKMRQDHFRRFGIEMWFMDRQETPRKFYIIMDSLNVGSNLAAFYDWGPVENNREYFGVSEFRQDYSYWRVIKFQVIDSVLKFYVDGALIRTLNFPSTIPTEKFYGFGLSSVGPAGTMAAEIDYVKCYDKDGNIFYQDDFNGCSNRPLFASYIRCPKQPCTTAFTEYLNEELDTDFTYTEIQNLYGSKNLTLNICDPSIRSLTLCGNAAPSLPTATLRHPSPCNDSTQFAVSVGTLLYEAYRDSLINHFNDRYLQKCLEARYKENFTVQQPISEYHYTLYYYDLAGNLVKTIPPAGVNVSKFGWTTSWSDSVKTARKNNQVLPVPHSLRSEYRYNTLNQLEAQKSPDGGLTEFWYDRLGRLALSRNAKQLAASSSAYHLFSYTRYDNLGRITEVGQLRDTATVTAVGNALTRNGTNFSNWFNLRTHYRHQVTQTVYDTAFWTGPYNPLTVYQRNLRNRVSFVALYDTTGSAIAYNNAVFYTYDILGNVDTLLNDYGYGADATSLWNMMNRNGNRWKKIVYNYDLISGKVNTVAYQRGYTDQFFQRYSYDAENRLILAESSRDSAVWEREATYEYYRHGALARMVLGQQQVQGMDYAYTLQGWLKGINSTGGTATHDMGGDGLAAGVHQYTARDALGVTLNYFAGEYSPVSSGVNPFPNYSAFLNINYKALFNGNISSSSVYNKRLGDVGAEGGAMLFYNYRYDQLNRLTGMDVYNGFDSGGNDWDGMQLAMNNGQNRMKENVRYDANGNILAYRRVGANGHTMDSLQYSYYPNTNQLRRITDSVSDGAFPGSDIIYDIDNQTVASNYVYDAIGNLIQDKKEQIDTIKWNVYGKITEIKRTSTGGAPVTAIKYFYDALGNRIGKVFDLGGNKRYTWYVRDAQGNVLSIYDANPGGDPPLANLDVQQAEQYLYGSSRLGMHANGQNVDNGTAGPGTMQFYSGGQMFRGKRNYELTNHLGNVLAVVTDKKIGVSSGGSLNDYYNADIVSATDYYPFGMAARVTVNLTNYTRFGFNGKEFDWEVKGWQNQVDYGMRTYDPRIGRFFAVDPISMEYPMLAPYQYASNNPVRNIDIDGLEGRGATVTVTPARPALTPIRGGGKGGAYVAPPMHIVPGPEGEPFNTSGMDLEIRDAHGGLRIIRSEAAVKLDNSGDRKSMAAYIASQPEYKFQRAADDAIRRFDEIKKRSTEGIVSNNLPGLNLALAQVQSQKSASAPPTLNLKPAAAPLATNGPYYRNPQTAYEQYVLVASKDGWYPVMQFGQGQQGEIWLKKGEVWKIGTTVNPNERYTQKFLDNTGQGLTYITENKGTEAQVLTWEQIKLWEHRTTHGDQLPAGNTKMQ